MRQLWAQVMVFTSIVRASPLLYPYLDKLRWREAVGHCVINFEAFPAAEYPKAKGASVTLAHYLYQKKRNTA